MVIMTVRFKLQDIVLKILVIKCITLLLIVYYYNIIIELKKKIFIVTYL